MSNKKAEDNEDLQVMTSLAKRMIERRSCALTREFLANPPWPGWPVITPETAGDVLDAWDDDE